MTPFGLCARCTEQREVRTGRGSVFSMCLRHKTDARYRKYPPVPVVTCPGFEPRPADDEPRPRAPGR